jgi:hypothetical protein
MIIIIRIWCFGRGDDYGIDLLLIRTRNKLFLWQQYPRLKSQTSHENTVEFMEMMFESEPVIFP